MLAGVLPPYSHSRTQAGRVADISSVTDFSARGRKNSGRSCLAVKILWPGGETSLSLTAHCLDLVTGLYQPWGVPSAQRRAGSTECTR